MSAAPLRPSLFLRVAVSLGLLGALAWALDGAALAARLAHLSAPWAGLALALSVPQVALSAWRWRFTAARLGVALPFRDALREYYLATFLNQVLPGGVAGDVSRAWRHARVRARAAAPVGPAVRAVVLERASGQAVMVGAAALSLLALPSVFRPPEGLRGSALLAAAAAAALVGAGGLLLLARRLRGRAAPTGTVRREVHAALLARDAWPAQLLGSAAVVASYGATYLAAARAVGVATPTLTLLPLVAPVLMSMLIPATIAGWGVREATAAALWGLVGLTPEDGVAISAAYGVLVLLGSLPGAVVLAARRRHAGG